MNTNDFLELRRRDCETKEVAGNQNKKGELLERE